MSDTDQPPTVRPLAIIPCMPVINIAVQAIPYAGNVGMDNKLAREIGEECCRRIISASKKLSTVIPNNNATSRRSAAMTSGHTASRGATQAISACSSSTPTPYTAMTSTAIPYSFMYGVNQDTAPPDTNRKNIPDGSPPNAQKATRASRNHAHPQDALTASP